MGALGCVPALAAPPANDARGAAQPLGALPADVRRHHGRVRARGRRARGVRASAPRSGTRSTPARTAHPRRPRRRGRASTPWSTCSSASARRSRRSTAPHEPPRLRDLRVDARAGATTWCAWPARELGDRRFRLASSCPSAGAPPGRALPAGASTRSSTASRTPTTRGRCGCARAALPSTRQPGSRCARVSLHGPARRASIAAGGIAVRSPPRLHAGRLGRLHAATCRRRAPRATRIRYRLRVRPRPGRRHRRPDPLADDRASGPLQGSELDAVDLYRFTIATREHGLRLQLDTGADFELRLLDERATIAAGARSRAPARARPLLRRRCGRSTAPGAATRSAASHA